MPILICTRSHLHGQAIAYFLGTMLRRTCHVASEEEDAWKALENSRIFRAIVWNWGDTSAAGFSALKRCAANFPNIPILMVLDSAAKEDIVASFRQGASGIISATDSLQELLKALVTIRAGGVWAPRGEGGEDLRACGAEEQHRFDQEPLPLTCREREILGLISCGKSNRTISEELGISEKTVKCHAYNAYRKIGVRNRVEAANEYKTRLVPSYNTITVSPPSTLA